MPSLTRPGRRARSEDSDEDSTTTRANTPQSTGLNDSKRARRSLATEQQSSPSSGRHESQSNGKRSRRQNDTQNEFQPGSIVRVKLTNFVTYTSAEFFPGPHLNMVIGPNGTGKSTLVCAICLGLGWGPQHLGRAKDISEFVKHGCQEAEIEIELAADPRRFRRNPVVCRTIKKEGNKSTFTINGKQAARTGVLDLARSFSIQIDNLCQFLPQDKVVEFAAMTPVELLLSTEQAAGPPEMLERHEDLKKLRGEQKRVLLEMKGEKEQLKNLENRQDMTREAVERFKQRTEIKERIEWLERCRPVPLYRAAHAASRATKETKKRLNQELRQLRRETEPTLRKVNAKQEYVAQLKQLVHHRNQMYTAADRDVEAVNLKIEKCNDKISELDHQLQAEHRSGKAKREEQKRYSLNIRTLQKRMEEEPEPFDPAEINVQVREKLLQVRELGDRAREIREKVEELKEKAGAQTGRIEQIQRDMERLETSSGQQEVKLQRRSADSHRAWKWIQENQDKFRQRVFGPPMVECSLKDPKFADAVESLFQNNDFLIFTVQSRDDFRLLQRELNEQMGLHDISIRTSTNRLNQFHSPISEDQMKQLGFEGYALDLLNGPEPVLAMLCSEKRLHQTPIGFHDISDQQYRQIEQSGITSWVSGGHSYQITRRREYGDAGISSRVRNIRKAAVWTDQPIDSGRRRELAMQKAEAESLRDEIKKELAEMGPKFLQNKERAQEVEKERNELVTEKERRQKALAEFKALPTKLAQDEQKLAAIVQAMEDIRTRMFELDDEKNDTALKKADLALKFAKAVSRVRQTYTALLEAEIMQIEAKSDYETLVARNQHINDMVKAKELEEKRAIEDHQKAAENAKTLVDEIMSLRHEAADDPRFDVLFQEISQQTTIEELEAEIDSSKAQLEITHEGDANTVVEYDKREKRITEIRGRMEENETTLNEINVGIAECRRQWEPALDALVGQISEAFSDNFARIGCAGQVSIYKASANDESDEPVTNATDNPNENGNGLDFSNWAIHVYVKFRESEPLSLLDSHRQSGGERAVSTIFYLMALQSLARSPFRVVDEINQGMDPRNERMVHGRMVDIACGNDGEGNGSQYFLITPKLLSGLKYNRGMKVLCIVSGEQMPGQKEIEGNGREPGVGKVDFKAWIKKAQQVGVGGGIGRSSTGGRGLGLNGGGRVTEVGA